MNTSKFIGCTMILIGTTIGAGMLALPMVSAAAGFTWSLVFMLIAWIASTLTGLLIIEVNLALPIDSCSYSSMAKQTLGNFGKIITWISYLFLLYALITAYVIGASGFITSIFGSTLHIEIPNWISAILFTFILGSAVFWGTEAVDYLNRILMSLKGLMLTAALAFLMPHIEISKLITPQNIHQINYLWLAIPTFVTAFGYHFVVPSLRMYIGDKPRQLKFIVIIGTTVAFISYVWWLAATLSIIPLTGENSFTSFAQTPGASSPAEFTKLLVFIVNNKWVTNSINGFANIALTTSFLGVALGLFDFLAEGFKRQNTRLGRLQTTGLTFIPPLLFAILYPQGFLKAINYAAIAFAILTLVLPALMAYYLRKNKTLKSPYRVKCSSTAITLIILFGAISIVLAAMYILDLLPNLKNG